MPAAKVDTVVRGGQVVTASEAYEAGIAIRGKRSCLSVLMNSYRLPPSPS